MSSEHWQLKRAASHMQVSDKTLLFQILLQKSRQEKYRNKCKSLPLANRKLEQHQEAVLFTEDPFKSDVAEEIQPK